MQAPEAILNHPRNIGDAEKHKRQYRLLHYITLELVLLSLVVIGLYFVVRLWALVVVISCASSLALLNLWYLDRSKKTLLCGHILTLIFFMTIIITNYLIWGIGVIHSQWFYVIPLLAAALTGSPGLIFYSAISVILVSVYGQFSIPAYYNLPDVQFLAIETMNRIFAYLIIVTTLINLLRTNEQYEEALNTKHHALRTEKDHYHFLSDYDQLTNLYNRRYFNKRLQEVISTLPSESLATVFFIDIDNFKSVNDTYGHAAGDELLKETAQRFQRCFREKDILARMGGDEFTALVLHEQNHHVPDSVAERIIEEFSKAAILDRQFVYYYSLSIGSATHPKDAKTATDLLIKADLAMYRAKKEKGTFYCK